MPQLTFKNIKRQSVLELSTALVDELEALMAVPRDYFTIEHADSMFIRDSQQAPEYPLVFVALFDRGPEMEDKAAKIITKHVQAVGYRDVDVIFSILEKSRYYENGEHF